MDKIKIEKVLLLGAFGLKSYDNLISIRGKKSAALLASIICEPSKRISRSYAEALLWSQRSPGQAKASLRQCLSDLRKQLAPIENIRLDSNRYEITLDLNSVSLDIENFNLGIATRDLKSKITTAESYRGPFLGGLCIADPAFEHWVREQRIKYLNNYVELLKNILNHLDGSDNLELTKVYAGKLLTLDKCSETAHISLMKCFYAEGDQAKAIRQFRICCDFLDKELSVGPSQELMDLFEKIRNPQKKFKKLIGAVAFLPGEVRNGYGLAVAVFPFTNIGVYAKNDDLSIDITGDIRTGLSKFKWISVASKYSTMNMEIENIGFQQLCKKLNIRYVIDGSIKRSKKSDLLKIQLLDGIESTIVWAESYLLEINNQQDLNKTLSRIICQLDVRLRTREIKRVTNLKADEFNAYDCVIRAVSNIQVMTPEALRNADLLFNRALILDPGFSAVYTWRIYWEIFCIGQGLASNHQREIVKANHIAREALLRDPDDSLALAMQGHFESFVDHNFVYAKELNKRAYELNPNSSMVLLLNSFTYSYCGNPRKALERLRDLEEMTHIEPQHEFFFYLAKSVAFTFARDYDAGIKWGLNCISKVPSFANGYKPIICCLGHLDRRVEAQPLIETLLALEPSFSIESMNRVYPFEKDKDREHYLNGLIKAGVTGTSRSTVEIV